MPGTVIIPRPSQNPLGRGIEQAGAAIGQGLRIRADRAADQEIIQQQIALDEQAFQRQQALTMYTQRAKLINESVQDVGKRVKMHRISTGIYKLQSGDKRSTAELNNTMLARATGRQPVGGSPANKVVDNVAKSKDVARNALLRKESSQRTDTDRFHDLLEMVAENPLAKFAGSEKEARFDALTGRIDINERELARIRGLSPDVLEAGFSTSGLEDRIKVLVGERDKLFSGGNVPRVTPPPDSTDPFEAGDAGDGNLIARATAEMNKLTNPIQKANILGYIQSRNTAALREFLDLRDKDKFR